MRLPSMPAEIRRLGKRVVGDIVEIGRRLTEVKKLVGHGSWLPWLQREFAWTDRHARNFMHVHEAFKSETASGLNIPITGIFLLAAPSTPGEARDEIVQRAKADESISVADVKATIGRAKLKPALSPKDLPKPTASEKGLAEIKWGHRHYLPQMTPADRQAALADMSAVVDELARPAEEVVEPAGSA
jgi:hypothetical protein